jgi:5-methylcytosine-specific restriction endonuclease McrA
MNKALVVKNVGKRALHHTRVLFFDPTEVYERIVIDKYKRTQKILVSEMFPVRGKKCRCGCSKPLKGRRTAWASNECSSFARDVQAIITGHSATIKKYLMIYYGWECKVCRVASNIKMDHIVGVKHGGGGCWLSNFQLLCHIHHVVKTNKDFGHKSATTKKKV